MNADYGITVVAAARIAGWSRRRSHDEGRGVQGTTILRTRTAEQDSAYRDPVEVIRARRRPLYLGMAQSWNRTSKRLVVDIGGGSTEVIAGDGFDIIRADSLFMGCVGYSKRFLGDGVLSSANFKSSACRSSGTRISQGRTRRLAGTRPWLFGTAHAIRQIVTPNGPKS